MIHQPEISNQGVAVWIDLARIRKNVEAILQSTGVPVIAVVKADAYGLGAGEVARAIGDLVSAFYVFDADEAVSARLWDITAKRTIALNGHWTDPQNYLAHHIQPVVWNIERARMLRPARPILSIDTGQQRFACPGAGALEACLAGDCAEVMTHAIRMDQVDTLLDTVGGWIDRKPFLHAAGSALLDEPRAHLNAVRPGLALYRGAVRVVGRLIEVRDSTGPAGYTGFVSPRFGVILAGYSSGLRRGPCMINGQVRRVIEVGMQSAFVEVGPLDRVGDEVELLGSHRGIDLPSVASAWGSSQQEVLCWLTRCGVRKYVSA